MIKISNIFTLLVIVIFIYINIASINSSEPNGNEDDLLFQAKSKDINNKIDLKQDLVDDEIDDNDDNNNDDDDEEDYNLDEKNSSTSRKTSNKDITSIIENNNSELDELSPVENNCRLVRSKLNGNNNSLIVCSKIPLFCRNICDNFKRIDFDARLTKITSFSFGSYQVKENLELNFKSNLERIDSDAFNGMVIDSDVQLVINVGMKDYNYDYYDEESLLLNAAGSEYQEDDEIDNDVVVENSVYVQNDDSLNQVEYDIEVKSTTKSSNKKTNKPAKTNRKKRDVINKSILNIQKNAFRGLKIKEGGSLLLKFKNLNYLQFNTGSLNGFKQLSGSSVYITADNVNFVSFKQKCAKSWVAYSKDEFDNEIDELEENSSENNKQQQNTNIIYGVLFRINVTNVNEVTIEKESFSNMKLFNSSTFQLLINRFNTVTLGQSCFSQIEQSKLANFELNLSNGKYLKIRQDVFSNLIQSERAKFLIYVHLNESNICLKNNTFSNLKQMSNSTLRLTFLLNQKNNLVFNENSFSDMKQDLNSIIQIYVLRPNRILIEQLAFSNLNQSKSSLFEIWASKSESDFIIKSNAFKNVRQMSESLIRLGFTYSSNGYFKQSPFSFVDLISDDSSSQVVYDFTQGTKFILKFPPRRVPRIMIPIDNKKQSLESISWKMYPNLGRTSRPDKIILQDYLLSEKDFCKIVSIPFDVLVKLNTNTKCSCSVYYLYRVIRKYYAESDDLNWLLAAPDCYRRDYLKSIRENNLDTKNDLDLIEEKCDFGKMIENCYVEQKSIDDNQMMVDNEKCDDDSHEPIDTDYDRNLAILEDSFYYEDSVSSTSSKKVLVSSTTISSTSSVNDMSYDDDDDDDDDDEDEDDKITKEKPSVNNDSYEDADYNNDTASIYGSYDLKEPNPTDYDDNYNEDEEDDKLPDEENDSQEIDYKLDDENTVQSNSDINRNNNINIDSNSNNDNILHSSYGLILIGIASIVLISIIVIIVIVMRCNRRSNGFSIYYDEEQDDEYYEDEYDSDDNDQEKSNKQIYTNSLNNSDDHQNDINKKSNLFSLLSNYKDQYNYSKLDNYSNKIISNDSIDKSKCIVVSKCNNRNNSIDSTVLSIGESNQSTPDQVLNIKTNPFSLISN